MVSPYDELYSQIDLKNKPFGYSMEYSLWREGQIKRSFMKHISAQGKLLDAGGGMGWLAKFLPKWFNLEDYYNLDPSRVMLSHSPYRNTLGSCEDIPFLDEFFDYVVCSEVLEHVQDKDKSISELIRVLKPGGLLIISTPRTGWGREFKNSPFIVFLLANKLWKKTHDSNSNNGLVIPEGVKDEPSDERSLRLQVAAKGVNVVEQYRIDNHVMWSNAGESRFWRWLSDRFIDPAKYGHSTVIIGKKKTELLPSITEGNRKQGFEEDKS